MKKYLYFSIAALALASCSNDEFLGAPDTGQKPPTDKEVAIGFGSEALRPTRADFTGSDAAEKLNGNFIVYGFKTDAAEAVNGTGDHKVFNLYNVNYEAGTAGTTESNSDNWEYVGINSYLDEAQTIKYWDLSADSYVFSAVAGTDIKATKIEKAVDGSALAFSGETLTVDGTATVRDKGWVVEIPAGGSLSDLYASDRLVATAAGVNPAMKYQDKVNLTFRALGTKIRFAIYEVVPGYSITIDRVWYNDGADKFSDTDFYIKGKFNTANPTTKTPLIVTYDENNRAKVSYNAGDVTTLLSGKFGSNLIGTKLGTASNEATYDQADKSYNFILPYQAADNVLKLKVNYTLKSTDSAAEEIHVYGATAYVPAQYTQWKPNYAYTYIFKISDKTNGTTVKPNDPDNPNDPVYKNDPDDPNYDPNDPNIGLSPITFDAVVITDELDVQETITTVAEPSITTYAQGIDATANSEYAGGEDVYVTVMDHNALASLSTANFHIYEVNNLTPNSFEKDVTEAMLENYMNNFCVLTEVTADLTVTDVPLTSGYNLTFAAGQVAKFTPAAGKIYAAEYVSADVPAAYTAVASGTTLTAGKTYYTAADGTGAFAADGSEIADGTNYYEKTQNAIAAKKTYKVIKTTGAPTGTPSFTLAQTDGSNPITTVAAKTVLTLKQGAVGVLGAKPNFKVTGANGNNGLVITPAATAGVYDVTVDPAAIKAGKANDTYTVDFEGQTVGITVNIANALSATAVTVTAGNATGATTTFTIAGALSDDGVIVNENEGIHIAAQGAGVYKVTADADVAYKAAGYAATIGGVALTINVDSYAFAADLVITNKLGGGSTSTLTLQKNGAALPAATAEVPAILWTDLTKSTGYATAADGADVTPAVNGQYLITANTSGVAGSYYVTYENAKAKVTVNSYAITAPASIAQYSGSATLEVKCGSSTTINATTADLVVTTPDAVFYADVDEYNTAKSASLTAAEFAALPTCDKVKTAGTAPYTVVTNGQTIKFSNATATGAYTFDYKVNGVIVAEATITVTL